MGVYKELRDIVLNVSLTLPLPPTLLGKEPFEQHLQRLLPLIPRPCQQALGVQPRDLPALSDVLAFGA